MKEMTQDEATAFLHPLNFRYKLFCDMDELNNESNNKQGGRDELTRSKVSRDRRVEAPDDT